MKVFEYVVIYNPSAEAIKEGAKPAIIAKGMKLKKDQRSAEFEIQREIPKEYDEKIDDVIVSIRPF